MKFEFPLHNSAFADKKRVIAFEFTAVNKIDQGLMKMSACMNSRKQHFEQPVKGPWYKNKATKGNVTLHMRQFSSYVKSKAICNDESIIFIVTDASEDTCICDNAVRIVSYTNGELDDQDFETPSPYQIMTPPLVAGPPGKPSVVNTTSNSISLKWEKPQEYPEYTHSYKVLYSRDDLPNSQWKSQLTDSVVEHITISELIPNKCYYFKVQALYHKTAGQESLVSDAISTEHVVFGPPGECIAEDVTHDSVTLYWSKPPNINPCMVECYKVLYRFECDPHGDWKSKITEDGKTNIKIHGLSPETKYIFKVQAGSSDHHFGKESKESDAIMTKSAICSPPGKPQVEVRDSSVVQLKWTKPLKYAGTIQHYVVLYSSMDEETRQWKKYDQNSTTEGMLVEGLAPDTRYCFKILAECNNGASEESQVSDTVETPVPIPSKPGQPVAVSVTSKSISLVWAKPAQYAEYVTKYCVSYCSQESKEWLLLHVDGERETVTVTELSPKTTYLFKVQAQSKTGFSETSEVSKAICIQPPHLTQPGQPQAVYISHDKITITWAKPQKNAEYTQNYTIHYKSLQKSHTHGWTTAKTESAVEELIVSGLEPNASYIFKVQAENANGPSKESETSNVIHTLVPKPSKPGQPKAVSVTSKSINLIWAKPLRYSEYVMKYLVSYCSQEQAKEWLSLCVQGEKESVAVTGLSPKTTYLFKVQAQSTTRFSEMSEVSTYIHTLPPVPSQPGQPQAVYISHDKITLTWAKPRENAEYIQNYTIHYKSLQKSHTHGWTTVKTNCAMEELVVGELEVNTRYIFKVQAESADGTSKESETCDMIHTLVPIPSKPGQPKVVSVTSKSINLIWTKPTQYSEYVMKYYVSYCSQEQSKEWLSLCVQGEKETIAVTGLFPKTTYLFKVQAQSKTGFSEMSEVSTCIHTLPPVPSQPGQPQAVHISHDNITLTWAKPRENAEYIKNYTVHYKSLQMSDKHGWTTVKTKSAVEELVVSGLEPNTRYIFKVQAESADGTSKDSETSNTVETLVPVPSKPGQPVAVSVTSKSINLIWAKPAQYAEYVTKYCVSYRSQESKEWLLLHVDGERETVTVTGLSPKTTYLFKVQAQSKTGPSEMGEVSTAICILPPDLTQPGQPQALNISHDKITITWAKPQENAEYIQNYTICYKSLQKSDHHVWTKVKTESAMEELAISGLEVDTSYIFKVKAESADGPSKESETSNIIQTLVPIPSKPGQPKSVSVTHNSVNLKWTKPTHYSEYVMKYHVSYCPQEQSKEWISLCVRGEEETVAVTGLSPKTTYLFKVQAQSKTRFSEMSDVSTGICTLPPVPSQPGQPQAVNISHDKIIITWAKPQENAEYIQNYTICYKSLQKSDHHVWTKVKTESPMEELAISGLEVDTSYIFKVKAESADGPSKESETSNIIQTLVPIPSKPGQPKSVSVTHNSVNLKWTKPTHYSEYVMKYHVSYCPQEQSKEWISLCVRGEEETVAVTGLSPKTTYLFKVQAQSKTRFSKMSEVSTGVHTLSPVPSQPSQPQAVHISHDKIIITWAKPVENATYVLNYTIHYKSIQKSDEHGWTTVKTECAMALLVVSGLEVNTRYIFKVQAESVDGSSKESEASNIIQTLVPIPSKPGQPKAVSVTHNSVNLKWTKPTNYSEYVMNYHVNYCSQEQSKEWISLRVQGEKETVAVTGLSPKTTYLFKVQAQSKTGFSEMSEVSAGVHTLFPVPSQPGQPQAVHISHDKIKITWAKPQLYAEFVQNYTIHYIPIKNISSTTWWTTVNTESAVEEFEISGLEVNTSYLFKVQAKSVDRSSEYSETSSEIQTAIPIPGKPEQPKIVSVTYNSVSLEWAKPTQYSEFVTSYQGYYFSQEEPEKQKSFIEVEEKLTVTGLSPETMYVFRLHAQSKTGSSDINEVSICTLPPVPSQPGQPQAVTLSDDKITITWPKPQENAEYIQSYTIKYTKDSETHEWTTVNTVIVKEVLKIIGLEPNTNYIFKVQAESTKGSSRESKVSNAMKTRSPIPSQPGKPKCKNKAHDRITLCWPKPNEYYENVECYEISYSNNMKENVKTTYGRVEEIEIDGLDPQKGYYFKVKAKSKFGDSLNSLSSDLIGTNPVRPVLKIIPCCKKLQDSPTVYHFSMTQVTPTDAQDYAKFEYGKATDGTTNKVLMIVGATGSGKSTLINGMINYLLGVEWDDEFRLKLIHEEVESQTKSVTKLISAYTFHKQDNFPLPYSLTIVDTAGFGDTEGIARDKEITSQIKEFFSLPGERGIDHLDGIGFVTQGGLPRLTPTQIYIFDSIFAIFGKDMKDNIFTMVTFADSADPPVIGAIKEAAIPCTEYFQFNNSALYTDKKDNQIAKMFWVMGATCFSEFFDKFGKSRSVSLKLTREVLDNREQLEIIIIGLQQQIHDGMSMIDSLKQQQQVLEQIESRIKANEDFEFEVEEDALKKIALKPGEYTLNCVICNFTCQFPCYIGNDEEKYRCDAMKIPRDKNTTCTVCPGKCAWNNHRSFPYRLEVVKNKVTKCYENVKKMYYKAVDGKRDVKIVIANIDTKIQHHFRMMLQNIQEVHSCIKRLDEIAFKPHPLSDVDYIDLLIESEKQGQKPGFRKRIQYYNAVRQQAELISKIKQVPQLSPAQQKEWWKQLLSLQSDELAATLPPVQFKPKKK